MQKQRKFNPKNGAHKFQGRKKVGSVSWQPVKLNGPVIADEGADFGGFVGLEILENYSGDFVRKELRKSEKEAELNGKKKKSKRKFSDDSDDESDSEEEIKPKKKQKKIKPAKRTVEDSSEDDSGFDDQPKKKGKDTANKRLATKTTKNDNGADASHEQANVPAFSMLLKPSTIKQTQQKVKETEKESVAPVAPNNAGSKKQTKNSKQNEAAKGPVKSNARASSSQKTAQKKTKGNNGKVAESQPESYSSVDYMAWIQLGVSEPIVKALADKGFKVPTEIQTQSLPVAIYGRRDLLGAAETGSGKTLAFGIPMLEGIMRMKNVKQKHIDDSSEHELTPPPEDFDSEDERVFAEEGQPLDKNSLHSDKPLYGLILTPTRELAVQINDHLKAVAKYTGINIATIFGGLAAVKQERLLRKCPEIVIATPGRLWELIQSENHHLSKVADIKFLVIDETDRMLEKGHFDELKQLLELINANEEAKKLRRNYIFSATLTMDHEMPDHLKKNVKKSKKVLKQTPGQRMDNLIEVIGMTNPKIVDLTQDHGTARTLTQSRILCQADHKDFYLYYFLERHPGRTLVFCNSIDCVKRLVSLFDYLDCQPLSLFGSMQQRQRLKNLERFTANPRAVLIATDVAARGLDIPNVDHVIHYQVPKTTENYVHRSGRTARASKEGLTVLLIAPNEVRDYVKLNQDLGRTEDLPLYPTSERMMRQVKDRVQLAREIERMDHQQRRDGADRSWEDQLAKEFRDDSEVDSEQEELRRFEDTKRKRQFRAKRLELSQLLARPIVPDRIEMNYPSLNISGTKNLQAEKNPSAISIVRDAEQQRLLEKKQRKNKKKAH